LAGGIGAIAASFLAVEFILGGRPDLAVLAFSFAGALGGFLLHNYPPARIFMGDSGSLFIGLFLAGLALAPVPGLSRGLFAVVIAPAVVLAIPILDTTFVTVTRLLEGRPISQGGRDHTSHGLVALGMSEKRAMWILWSLALAGGLIGLIVRTRARTSAYLLGGVLLLALTLFGIFLLTQRIRRVSEESGREVTLFEKIRVFHMRAPVLSLTMDALLVGLAYYSAYLIRWDEPQLGAELVYFQRTVLLVVVAKLLALVAVGAYRPGWRFYGLSDVLTVARGNLLGTLLAVAAMLLVSRVGLSRGVIIIDLMVSSALTVAGRLSFRFLEGTTQRWSQLGEPVAVLGSRTDAGLAIDVLARDAGLGLRPVCIVDVDYPAGEGRFRGYPLFGKEDALQRAVRDCGVGAVLLIEGPDGTPGREVLDEHLQTHGGIDSYVLSVGLRRLSEAPGS
jgi:UDP-GlcNAc:undecaprenyl-phosphate/decaprenyl-phosphate GlcNAc-1-phosphate transferase